MAGFYRKKKRFVRRNDGLWWNTVEFKAVKHCFITVL